MDSEPVRYMHFRLTRPQEDKLARRLGSGAYLPKGGITVAYQMFPVPGEPEKVSIKYHLAICSTKDHYNKRIGRVIARGRLLQCADDLDTVSAANWYEKFIAAVQVIYINSRLCPPNAYLVASSREPRPKVAPKLSVVKADDPLVHALRV